MKRPNIRKSVTKSRLSLQIHPFPCEWLIFQTGGIFAQAIGFPFFLSCLLFEYDFWGGWFVRFSHLFSPRPSPCRHASALGLSKRFTFIDIFFHLPNLFIISYLLFRFCPFGTQNKATNRPKERFVMRLCDRARDQNSTIFIPISNMWVNCL